MVVEEDMDYQIGNISMQEQYLKRELAGAQVFEDIPDIDNWEELALEHLVNLQVGLDSLSQEAMSEEVEKEQFQLKREVVLALVEKVLIGKNRKMQVIFKLDVLSLLGIDSTSSDNNCTNSKFAANKLDGICNRKQSCLLHRRCAACG